MDELDKQKIEMSQNETPKWLTDVLNVGFEPYIATSEHLLASFNLKPFGVPLQSFAMHNPTDKPFLDAYLTANFLSFGSKDADYKMPSWVYVDCVLLPVAVVGFMAPKSLVPDSLLAEVKEDAPQSFAEMTHIPITGQIDTHAADGSFVNFSLFSLGRRLNGFQKMALYTKALSTEVHGIRDSGKDYRVILQYNNPSMKVHGMISSRMEIEQPMVPLHPSKDMTLVAKMLVDYDPHKLDQPREPIEPSFPLEAGDVLTKCYMQEKIRDGYTYAIVPPYVERRRGRIFLSVREYSPQP